MTDVAERQRAGAAEHGVVEARTPGIAHAERPDLVQGTQCIGPGKRVVGGNPIAARVGVRHAHVDAQDLSEQRERTLRLIARIATGAAVAHEDVQVAVRAEGDLAAVVIGEGLADEALLGLLERDAVGTVGVAVDVGHGRPEQIEARGLLRYQGIGRRATETRDDGGARGIGADRFTGEVHVEAARPRVVGRERESEQAALTATDRLLAQVEEGRGEERSVADDSNQAGLLNDVLHRGIRRVLDHPHRHGQTRDVGFRSQLRAGVRRRTECHHDGEHPDGQDAIR